jgi:AcrR family transcriptional regulator
MSGLRERNKTKRRDAVVDSTLSLLRHHPLAEVSVERIADGADVSPATVYNLVGTREHVLIACVERVLLALVDTFALQPNDDPIATAEMIVDRSAAAFIADGAAYRQIIGALGALGGFSPTGKLMAFDPAQLQVAAMREARQRGILRRGSDPAAVGRQIYLSYNGALLAWAGRALSDEGLTIAVRHGLYTALAACAADDHRTEFVRLLDRYGRRLVAAGWAAG